MEKYDVVIVGAGVAGSVLGRLLAQKDISVLLVEKDAFSGKTTACGGLFDKPYFDRYVDDGQILEQHITKNIFVLPWGEVEYDCDQVTVKRRKFDRYLAGQAAASGACLKHKTQAVDWELRGPGQVIITLHDKNKREKYQVEGKIIAFADGPHSLAARNSRFDPENVKKYWAYAYAYEVEGIPFEAEVMKIYLDPVLFPWGYGWIFPNKEDSNIGVGTIVPEVDKGGKLKNKLFDFIDEYKLTAPLLKNRAIVDKKGGFIPMWLIDHYSDESQVVLGDAAGMVSPLFGAGIDYAIDAAEACAPVLIDALKKEDFSARQLGKYDDAVKNGFIKDLRKQMVIAKIIIHSKKFGKQWPIKILAAIAFGAKYNRWNKIKILMNPLLGRPRPLTNNRKTISHK